MDAQSALVRQRSKIDATTSATFNQAVEQLIGFGMSPAGSKMALGACNNNVEAAMNWMLDDANAAAIEAEEEAAAVAASQEAEPDMSLTRATSTNSVEILVGRGFTPEAAKYALAIYNDDVTLAQAWLDDPKNEETLGKIDTATPGEGSPDMTAEDDAGESFSATWIRHEQ